MAVYMAVRYLPAFVFATRCKVAASAPIEPLISRHHLTRHPTYRRDKLSRLAPPSKLIEAHSPCRIRRLAGGRALGASFAGAMALLLAYRVWVVDSNGIVKGNIELFPIPLVQRRAFSTFVHLLPRGILYATFEDSLS